MERSKRFRRVFVKILRDKPGDTLIKFWQKDDQSDAITSVISCDAPMLIRAEIEAITGLKSFILEKVE